MSRVEQSHRYYEKHKQKILGTLKRIPIVLSVCEYVGCKRTSINGKFCTPDCEIKQQRVEKVLSERFL